MSRDFHTREGEGKKRVFASPSGRETKGRRRVQFRNAILSLQQERRGIYLPQRKPSKKKRKLAPDMFLTEGKGDSQKNQRGSPGRGKKGSTGRLFAKKENPSDFARGTLYHSSQKEADSLLLHFVERGKGRREEFNRGKRK